MSHLPSPFRSIRALLLPVLALVLTACNAPQQRVDNAIRAYDSEDFAKAYDEASAAQSEAQPPLKQKAALYAGLAAYRQKNLDEARSRLGVAETSDDKQVAGEAKFVLGNVFSDQRVYDVAAQKYDEAASMLTGEQASKARELASKARAEAQPVPTQVASADESDDAPAAKGAAKPASKGKSGAAAKSGKGDSKSGAKADPKSGAKDGDKGKAADAGAKSKSGAKSGGDAKGGFTIQCGAYAKEADARKRAKELADDAKKAGLPAPDVKRVTGRDGKKLWVVTIGSFKTRADGKKALAKLKIDHAEVLPVTG